jgi:peptidoglycan/LPS O-acetylase OafA/YrhL
LAGGVAAANVSLRKVFAKMSDPSTSSAAPSRLVFLDGVRGWASLMVVFSHLVACFLAITTPSYRQLYFTFFCDGTLAVYIFFVLSGFALSIRFLQTGDARIPVELALRRYPRLTLPIFASSAIAFVLMKSNLFFNAAASIPAHSQNWLGTFYLFEPELLHFLKFSLYNVYFHYDIARSYNQVLWTMSVEFFGSMLVFFLCLIYPYLRSRCVVLGILTAVMAMMNSPMLPFVLGMGIAQFFTGNARKRQEEGTMALLGSLLLIAATMIYSVISLHGFPTVQDFAVRPTFLSTIFAAVFVFGISISSRVRGFFSNALSRYLGSISFPLYLTHLLVICSFSSWLFLQGTNTHVVLLASLAACLVAASLFRVVERASISLARRCSDALMNKPAAL